jgi:hypothetical protein
MSLLCSNLLLSFDFDAIDNEISASELTEKKEINIIKKDTILNSNSKQEIIKDSVIEQSEIATMPEGKSVYGDSSSGEKHNIIKEEVKKIELKNYSNVKYIENYKWFSILDVGEDYFQAELLKRNMNIETFVAKINSDEIDNSADTIFMSAIYYDYILKRPDIAENFYLEFRNHFKGKMANYLKLHLADFLIRTGRYKHLNNNALINAADKFSSFGCGTARLRYYAGVLEYLNTKNKKNSDMRAAANCKIEKAQEFLK